MTASALVERLAGVRAIQGGWTARCPAHDDERASLSVSEGEKGTIVHCHAGCTAEAIMSALGLSVRELFLDDAQVVLQRALAPAPKTPPPLSHEDVAGMERALRADAEAWRHVVDVLRLSTEAVAVLRLGLHRTGDRRWLAYPYQHNGRFTFANCRSLSGEKDFLRFPKGQQTTLYRQDTLEPNGVAILFEGERDAAAALTMGLAAEVNEEAAIVAMPGADQTRPTVAALSSQRLVYLFTDSDKAGDEAAEKITRGLGQSKCRRVRLRRHKDLGDVLAELGPEKGLAEALTAFGPAPQTFASLSIGASLAREEEKLELGPVRIATGWERLDRALGGGLEVPSLTVLGAAPKSGKSTWAQIIATRHALRNGVVYYLDLENGRLRFLRSILCRRAEIGPKQAALALSNERAGVFASRADADRWRAAKEWVRATLAAGFFCEHAAPGDMVRRFDEARTVARDRRLLVVIDSLQKLPGDPRDDRRTTIDKWIRLFERLRYDFEAAIVAISEIRRGLHGYTAREDAFKESGGIEYAADLGLTLNRPAADEKSDAPATLRVEFARDCEDDPRGEVASYHDIRPFYGLEEIDPVPISKAHGRPAVALTAAVEFLRELLSHGAVSLEELKARAKTAGHSEHTIKRARAEVGAVPCTVNLRAGVKLP